MNSALLDNSAVTARVREARDFLLAHREDYDTAYRDFRWPAVDRFNWALDWFDGLAAEGGERLALWIVEEDGSECRRSFAELSARSNQVANWLRDQGVRRGDRMIVMLGNQVELWELTLAAMKLGAVVIPATPLLGPERPRRPRRARRRPPRRRERARRREVRRRGRRLHAHRDRRTGRRVAALRRRRPGGDRASRPTARPRPRTRCCCTSPPGRPTSPSWSSTVTSPIPSGTSRPCTGPGSSRATSTSTSPRPGWGKHAWSNVYAPWLAEATVMVFNYTRFDAEGAARSDRPLRREHVLRAADRVADADPGGPRALVRAAARGALRRRAAEPRGDRAGPAQVADHGPRRLRADRDARPRSATRLASRSSPARWAVRCPATASCCSTRRPASPATRGRSPSTWPAARWA